MIVEGLRALERVAVVDEADLGLPRQLDDRVTDDRDAFAEVRDPRASGSGALRRSRAAPCGCRTSVQAGAFVEHAVEKHEALRERLRIVRIAANDLVAATGRAAPASACVDGCDGGDRRARRSSPAASRQSYLKRSSKACRALGAAAAGCAGGFRLPFDRGARLELTARVLRVLRARSGSAPASGTRTRRWSRSAGTARRCAARSRIACTSRPGSTPSRPSARCRTARSARPPGNPGMLKVFGAIGGCPRGAYSFLTWDAHRAAREARPGSRGAGISDLTSAP